MGLLYLIRHGQASFGADDYDRLSDLGHRQCRALGEHLAQAGVRPTSVWRGSLHRHDQSLQAIAAGYDQAGHGPLPEATVWPGLNEYDSHALLQAHGGPELPPPDTPEGYKAHFRRLREALQAWTESRIQPQGMPSFAAFRQGVVDALDRIRQHDPQGCVLLVSSGGPISTAVGQVLEAPPTAFIEMNLRMRNSSVTEFAYTSRRHQLVSFNAVPHLADPERRHWLTHA